MLPKRLVAVRVARDVLTEEDRAVSEFSRDRFAGFDLLVCQEDPRALFDATSRMNRPHPLRGTCDDDDFSVEHSHIEFLTDCLIHRENEKLALSESKARTQRSRRHGITAS